TRRSSSTSSTIRGSITITRCSPQYADVEWTSWTRLPRPIASAGSSSSPTKAVTERGFYRKLTTSWPAPHAGHPSHPVSSKDEPLFFLGLRCHSCRLCSVRMTQSADQFALTGRAFKIQFRAEADIARGICCGRIEHVRSGDAAHFANVQELLAFVQLCM